MIKKVYRQNGKVINIGEWDYATHDAEDGTVVVGNPLPEDAVAAMEEVVVGWDGGLYAATDPRKDGAPS
ncbi:hypothetical protein D3C72_671700 [compost metagenome]